MTKTYWLIALFFNLILFENSKILKLKIVN